MMRSGAGGVRGVGIWGRRWRGRVCGNWGAALARAAAARAAAAGGGTTTVAHPRVRPGYRWSVTPGVATVARVSRRVRSGHLPPMCTHSPPVSSLGVPPCACLRRARLGRPCARRGDLPRAPRHRRRRPLIPLHLRKGRGAFPALSDTRTAGAAGAAGGVESARAHGEGEARAGCYAKERERGHEQRRGGRRVEVVCAGERARGR